MFPRLAGLFLALITVATSHAAFPVQPNIVLIFIDDLGYGDIGPFGSTLNRTPHLDRMAREGLKLTSFYVAAPVCTPSRAALMTGSYPMRVGLARGSGHAVLFPGDVHGLHPDEITIAEVLRDAGYATGCFGKWHLGDQPGFQPLDQGFDTYYGIPYSNDMWPPLNGWFCPTLPILKNRKVVDAVDDMDEQSTLCRRFTEAAVEFIRDHRERPFFCYVPHAFVHHPRQASARFMKGTPNPDKATGGQIEEVDWSVGEILGVLRELKLEKKTLVVFTSDNGGARGCVNKPLRGGKGSAWEGGLREPTLAWWPGTIPPRSECAAMVTSMDLMPTLARLAGTHEPRDRVLDGTDIRDLLRDPSSFKTPHEAFYYYQGTALRAVRSGPWKLFANGPLYHLEQDIGESRNVAGANPQVVQRLQALLEKARVDLGDGQQKGARVRPVGVAKNPRTLLPRPGIEGEEAFKPTLEWGRRKR